MASPIWGVVMQTAPQFCWDSNIGKFIGPAQKSNLEKIESEAARLAEEKQAKLTRSKLMKTMAQQRLKSEVASLAAATAKTVAVFTPYIIPDAHALCSGLHLIKKMIKSEKFLFVIPTAVIESLDQMKKKRENYSAREAIKFLEAQLQSGSKFMKAQKPTETLMEGKIRKPSKMDIQVWWYQCVIDCGLYCSDHSISSSDTDQSGATVTLLLDKQLVELLKGDSRKSELQSEIIKTIEYGEDRGLEVDSVLQFYSKWQKQSRKS